MTGNIVKTNRRLIDLSNNSERTVTTSIPAVMSDGLSIFGILNGPIELKAYIARCVTPNNATATTFILSSIPTVGVPSDICGASASLANAIAGTIINLVGNTLATPPVISPAGTAISQLFPILIPTGILKLTIGVGSTTGTWVHHLRYMPLDKDVVVTPLI